MRPHSCCNCWKHYRRPWHTKNVIIIQALLNGARLIILSAMGSIELRMKVGGEVKIPVRSKFPHSPLYRSYFYYYDFLRVDDLLPYCYSRTARFLFLQVTSLPMCAICQICPNGSSILLPVTIEHTLRRTNFAQQTQLGLHFVNSGTYNAESQLNHLSIAGCESSLWRFVSEA